MKRKLVNHWNRNQLCDKWLITWICINLWHSSLPCLPWYTWWFRDLLFVCLYVVVRSPVLVFLLLITWNSSRDALVQHNEISVDYLSWAFGVTFKSHNNLLSFSRNHTRFVGRNYQFKDSDNLYTVDLTCVNKSVFFQQSTFLLRKEKTNMLTFKPNRIICRHGII